MANNCYYDMCVIGKKRGRVEQFVKALQYKDLKDGYHLCRVFSAYDARNGIRKEGDVWVAYISGDCAWSVSSGMLNSGYARMHGSESGEPLFRVWRGFDGKIRYANFCLTLDELCAKLRCACEVWSNESGIGFQEHYLIDANGTFVENECRDWTEGYDEDENGDYLERNPEKDTGGFGDAWGEFDLYDELLEEGE